MISRQLAMFASVTALKDGYLQLRKSLIAEVLEKQFPERPPSSLYIQARWECHQKQGYYLRLSFDEQPTTLQHSRTNILQCPRVRISKLLERAVPSGVVIDYGQPVLAFHSRDKLQGHRWRIFFKQTEELLCA